MYWSDFHNRVAVHSVVVNSNNQLHVDNNPSIANLPIDGEIGDNHLLNRQKRVLVFRPLFVYKQQQKDKQIMREKWKAQQELQQQQYQSNYEQQYYQQYLQNYYNQFTSSAGYYQNYNQPNYPYVEPINTNANIDDQFNYWSYNTDNGQQYDQYHNPYQHTASSSYYQSPTGSAKSPSQYPNSFDYYNSV